MYISAFTCLCGDSTLWRSWGWSYHCDTWCKGFVQSWWEKAGYGWEDLYPCFHWTQLGTLGICFFCLPSYVWPEIREGNTSVLYTSGISIFFYSLEFFTVFFIYDRLSRAKHLETLNLHFWLSSDARKTQRSILLRYCTHAVFSKEIL